MDTFAGHPVCAEPVSGAAGAAEAAGSVVAAVLAGAACARPPALIHICGIRECGRRCCILGCGPGKSQEHQDGPRRDADEVAAPWS